jgi:hypothetical protein
MYFYFLFAFICISIVQWKNDHYHQNIIAVTLLITVGLYNSLAVTMYECNQYGILLASATSGASLLHVYLLSSLKTTLFNSMMVTIANNVVLNLEWFL